MRILIERIEFCHKELDELLHDYWSQTVAKDDSPPLDMDWEFYWQLEDNDKLLVMTMRDEGQLLGFVMYAIVPHPHHRGMVNAICDILATRLNMRGKGIGTELVNNALEYFKRQGIHSVIHGFRTCYDTEPLFPKLDFKLVEEAYVKRL